MTILTNVKQKSDNLVDYSHRLHRLTLIKRLTQKRFHR